MEAVTRRAKRGFNLIEAAIVLSVVGLVVGAIWSAAANFYESYKVNKTIEGVFTIARNLQNLISISQSIQMGSVDITDLVIQSSSAPKDWVRIISIERLQHPLTRGSSTNTVRIGNEPAAFGITLYSVSQSECINLITKAASIASEAGKGETGGHKRPTLGFITIGSNSTLNFPISPDDAQALCLGGPNVNFGFGYTRINN